MDDNFNFAVNRQRIYNMWQYWWGEESTVAKIFEFGYGDAQERERRMKGFY